MIVGGGGGLPPVRADLELPLQLQRHRICWHRIYEVFVPPNTHTFPTLFPHLHTS